MRREIKDKNSLEVVYIILLSFTKNDTSFKKRLGL